MTEWWQTHWQEGGFFAVGFGVIKLLLNRELKRYEEQRADHEERIRALEKDRVTRADIDELRQSLTASVVNVGERIEAQMKGMHEENRESTAQARESIERIHERVDSLWERRQYPRG